MGQNKHGTFESFKEFIVKTVIKIANWVLSLFDWNKKCGKYLKMFRPDILNILVHETSNIEKNTPQQ